MKGTGIIDDSLFLIKNFNIRTALEIRVLPTIKSKITGESYYKMHNEALLNFLENLLQPVIKKFKEVEDTFSNNIITDDLPIWVCWWQGEENMPPIIAKCYENLVKNSNGREINLITENNYREYVDLPQYILSNVQKGIITITHLSDILRTALLSKHGGFWVDATIWATQKINLPALPFFSLKQNLTSDSLVSNYRWAGNCMASGNNNILVKFLYESLLYYWSKENDLIVYLLLDYLIEIAYRNFETTKAMIDDLMYTSPNLHIMKSIMNEKYEESNFNNILRQNLYFKLNWKVQYIEFTKSGELTYFGKFMES